MYVVLFYVHENPKVSADKLLILISIPFVFCTWPTREIENVEHKKWSSLISVTGLLPGRLVECTCVWCVGGWVGE